MTLLERAWAWLEAHESELVELVCRLMACRSDIGNEAAIQRALLHGVVTSEMDFNDVELINVCPERDRPFLNLVWAGRGRAPAVLLNGHVEVVPVGDGERSRWSTDPWQPVVREGSIYGRGASDMKAGVAAILYALKAAMAAGARPPGDVLISLVCGEETGEAHVGSVAAARRFRERGWEPALAIIAEPTCLELSLPAAGQVDFSIAIEGRECHTAARNMALYPPRPGVPRGAALGADAFAHLARVLLLLEDIERQWALGWPAPETGKGAVFSTDHAHAAVTSSINRTFVEGGTYAGAVPGHARIEGVITYPHTVERGQVERDLRDRLAAFCQLDDWLRHHPLALEVGARFDEPPCAPDPRGPAARAAARAAQVALGATPARSPANYIGDATYLKRQLGLDAAYFGPGALWMGVHGPDERVPIEHVLRAAKVFAALILRDESTEAAFGPR